MTRDLIADLGHLTLGSRMRRIGERLQATTQGYLDRQGVGIQVSHLTVLYVLRQAQPQTIGEIAQTLGLSQPGVTRMVDRLSTEGWVTTSQSAEDRRQREVSLTDKAEALVDEAEVKFWPLIDASVAATCGGLSGSLLDQLGGFEKALTSGALDDELNTRTEVHDAKR